MIKKKTKSKEPTARDGWICCSVLLDVEINKKIQSMADERGLRKSAFLRLWILERLDKELGYKRVKQG